MGSGNYLSLLNLSGMSGHVALFSSSKGGETAGSVAFNSFSSSKSRFSGNGGETAGSVANSFSGGSSSCGSSCGSFTAIA